MLGLAGEVRQCFAYAGDAADGLGRSERLLTRLDRLSVAWAAHPLTSLRALLVLNALLAGLFLALGLALFGDPAEFFRELMPGTALSFVELAFVAAIAWSIHLRAGTRGFFGRYDNFWALSAGVFVVLAIDEITQATVFLADWLSTDAGLQASAGFRDLDAVLLSLLLGACALMLVRHVGAFRRQWLAFGLLAVGAVLGVCSQSLDSLLKATNWEFVAEESFKLAAEPFIVAGYLAALHVVLRRERSRDSGSAA